MLIILLFALFWEVFIVLAAVAFILAMACYLAIAYMVIWTREMLIRHVPGDGRRAR